MPDRRFLVFPRRPRSAEAWLARLGRARLSSRDLAAFQCWLGEDPRHLADYETLKALAAGCRTLKSAFTSEIAAIPPVSRRPGRARAPIWAGPAFGALAAFTAALVLLPSIWREASDPMAGAETITTEIGEIRDVTLADGSRLTLDTNTQLKVKLNASSRRLRLDAGQAYFDVAPDPDRPFEVALADRTVVVTGTRFMTTLIEGVATVALLEGSVMLKAPGTSASALRLAPGEAVRFETGREMQPQPRFNPDTAAEWRSRRRVFLDTPLGDVLADLSRYTPRQIVTPDPRVAEMRVTAVVPLDGPDSVIASIDRILPVSVAEVGPDRLEVRAE